MEGNALRIHMTNIHVSALVRKCVCVCVCVCIVCVSDSDYVCVCVCMRTCVSV